jgi:thioredoxin-related protein
MLLKSLAIILLSGATFFQVAPGYAQVQDSAEEAFRISSELNKPILLVFAGSDWCASCIRFEKKILTETNFMDFARENLVILKADFPQRKPLSSALQHQNALLAEQYNPKGLFPYLLLLGPEKSVVSPLPYSNQSPLEFIEEIRSHISK